MMKGANNSTNSAISAFSEKVIICIKIVKFHFTFTKLLILLIGHLVIPIIECELT